ncbi:Isoflavone 2'-hydroxylase protein [Dioscorea alata]|uniref:Isoflavone 2'-hydroxylase protein n=1 Tax=Dioscorea alata TaxID=55571 RepID=A0ACB7VT12_DIOAL|nr:Isoflavone 2'-hydroxylase protein [Dioscorea alata]
MNQESKKENIVQTMNTIIFTTIVLIILIKLLIFSKTQNKNKTKKPPSPTSLPILGHLHLLINNKQPLYKTLTQLSINHGPIMLLRFCFRHVLIVSSFSAATEFFTNLDIIFANRPKLPTEGHLTYNHTTLGTSSYGPHWRNIRRIVAVHLFSSAKLNSSSTIRAAETHALVRRLFKGGSEFKRVDIRTVLHEMVLNVMMMLVAGKRYYVDEGVGADVDEVKWFEEMVEETFKLSGMSNVRDFLPELLRVVDVHGVEKKLARLEKMWDEYLQRLIDELRGKLGHENNVNESIARMNLIGTLLAMQEDEDPDYYTDNLIKAQVLSLLSAGTDTSSATLEWGLSLLVNHPQVLKKAQDEIDELVGHDRLIKEFDIPNLPYLHCIVLEILRLYPAAPLLLPHESSQDCRVFGFDIPRGTILVVNAYAMHRDPEIWEDALVFKPERFLGGEEKVKMMMPFGMGRRRCPGEGLSFRLVELVLGALVQCFEWERVEDEEMSMEGGAGLDMHKAMALELMCKPRQDLIAVISRL